MLRTLMRMAGTPAALLVLTIPAISGATAVHAANGAVDTVVLAGGTCVEEAALPDTSGPCLTNITYPGAAVNAGVETFSGSATVYEPFLDPVTLNYSGQEVQVSPSCAGCPGAGVAVLVGTATDEGVTCPLVGTLQGAGAGSTFVLSGSLTWEGC